MAIYDVDGNEIALGGADVKDVIANGLRSKAFLEQIHSDSGRGMQGACTDGENIYFIYITTNTLNKLNIKTGAVTSKSFTSNFYGHANDMTYNPNTGKIYLTTMGDAAEIAVIDPATLEQTERIALHGEGGILQPNHGIAYDRIHDQYIFANATIIPGTYGQRYTVTDSSFNFIKTIVTPAPETYTIQGIETDGYFIYRALWNSSGSTNYVSVYDFSGAFVKRISIANSGELETVMQDWQGNWYCNFGASSSGSIYICGINSNPYESIAKLIALANA